MSINLTEPACYYFYNGEIGIISNAPGGAEAMKEHPELSAKTLKEWEALTDINLHGERARLNS